MNEWMNVDAGQTLDALMMSGNLSSLTYCFEQYVSSPIHTYCVGQAASMGSLLLAAGRSFQLLFRALGTLTYVFMDHLSRREGKKALPSQCEHHDTP
jgi:Clp protease